MEDSQERIEQCLHCTKPECNNCIGRSGRGATLVEQFKGKVQELCQFDLTDRQIAKLAGCSLNTVFRCRRLLGIPCQEERTLGRAAGV